MWWLQYVNEPSWNKHQRLSSNNKQTLFGVGGATLTEEEEERIKVNVALKGTAKICNPLNNGNETKNN